MASPSARDAAPQENVKRDCDIPTDTACTENRSVGINTGPSTGGKKIAWVRRCHAAIA
jgi:hypothetical protein